MIKGSEIVEAIKTHLLLQGEYARSGLATFNTITAKFYCNDMIKLAEIRHVLVEKDFTKDNDK